MKWNALICEWYDGDTDDSLGFNLLLELKTMDSIYFYFIFYILFYILFSYLESRVSVIAIASFLLPPSSVVSAHRNYSKYIVYFSSS